MENMKCIQTIFFDICGYFELTVFEIPKVNCIMLFSNDKKSGSEELI